jgi:hypothetical protein
MVEQMVFHLSVPPRQLPTPLFRTNEPDSTSNTGPALFNKMTFTRNRYADRGLGFGYQFRTLMFDGIYESEGSHGSASRLFGTLRCRKLGPTMYKETHRGDSNGISALYRMTARRHQMLRYRDMTNSTIDHKCSLPDAGPQNLGLWLCSEESAWPSTVV